MLTARYSSPGKELTIRLGQGDCEARFRLLGLLLQQFLDRNLREIGKAITDAMAEVHPTTRKETTRTTG
jgi:hypothetical protein